MRDDMQTNAVTDALRLAWFRRQPDACTVAIEHITVRIIKTSFRIESKNICSVIAKTIEGHIGIDLTVWTFLAIHKERDHEYIDQ